MAKVKGPPAVRVVSHLKLDKFLVKLANKKSVNRAVQHKVYETARDKFRLEYEIAYRHLLTQIIKNLSNGFPGAATGGSVTFYAYNPFSSGYEPISKKWAPLSNKYLASKNASASALASEHAGKVAAEAKARKGKRAVKDLKAGRAPISSANKFWVFRRNLVDSTSQLFQAEMAKSLVQTHKKPVKRGGVLVSGRNKATIRYSAELQFSKLKAPFDDMVRKPFMTGLAEKSRVWDDSPGSSAKKGFHAFAYVEAKRPFVVDLSASVGRMVRQRLKIE